MYFIYNQIWNGNAIATLKKLIYFNWRITTLQYSDGFFHILTWISHIATLFTTFYAFRYPSVCQLLSRVQLFVTSWTAAHQAPLSIGFSRQEYWSGLPFTSPGDLHDPRMEPWSSCIAGRFFIIWATREATVDIPGGDKKRTRLKVRQYDFSSWFHH